MNEIKTTLEQAVNILDTYHRNLKDPTNPLPGKVIEALYQIATLFEKNKEKLEAPLLENVVSVVSQYNDDSPIRKSVEIFRNQKLKSVGDLRKAIRTELQKRASPKEQLSSFTGKTNLTQADALSIRCERSIQDDRLSVVDLDEKTTEEHEKFLKKEMQQLFEERKDRLKDIKGTYSKIDFQNSEFMEFYKVCQKNFPKTYAWIVGAVDAPIEANNPIEQQMARIGEKYGIRVISDPPQNREKINGLVSLGTNNLAVYKKENFWQDCLEFTLNSIRAPRMRKKGEGILTVSTITVENRADDEQDFPVRGQVFSKDASKKALYLAKALEVPFSMNLTHCEGGNILPGKNNKGPYAIVGIDAYRLSKTLMEQDLGYDQRDPPKELSEEEVKMAFGIDYGVPFKRIYVVKQPGDFHLDMSLMVTDDAILLSDSKTAWYQFKDHPNRKAFLNELGNEYWKKLENAGKTEGKDKAEEIAQFIQNEDERLEAAVMTRTEFENRVFESLKDDFEVVRVNGRFHYTTEISAMNFFNAVTAINEEGKKIVIAGKCIDEDYESFFYDMLTKHTQVTRENIEFISLKTTQQLLAGGGSVQCNTKTISLK